MPETKTPKQQQTTAIVAIALALAGNADWFKPRDDSATRASYEATAEALDELAEDLDADLLALEERQANFELWVAKRLVEVDRDMLEEDVRASRPPLPPVTADDLPPNLTPPAAPPRPAAKAHKPALRPFDELTK